MGRKKSVDGKDQVSPEIKEALQKNDEEKLMRTAKTLQIEGELSYDKRVYVDEVRFFLQRSAEGIIEAGKRLLVIKEKEGYGNFRNVVENEIGIPKTTAYRFMNAALKADKFPAINLSQIGTSSKVYTLLEAPEEDLKELEEKGVLAGATVDELQRMSVKEMRELIDKLKHNTDKIVKEEVKALETEKKALVKEVERLKAFDPEGKDSSWCLEQMKAVEKAYNDLDTSLRKFAFDERVLDLPDIQAKVEGIQRMIEKRMALFTENWDAFVGGEE